MIKTRKVAHRVSVLRECTVSSLSDVAKKGRQKSEFSSQGVVRREHQYPVSTCNISCPINGAISVM